MYIAVCIYICVWRSMETTHKPFASLNELVNNHLLKKINSKFQLVRLREIQKIERKLLKLTFKLMFIDIYI